MSEKRKLKVLDLFSGIQMGGFSLGLEWTGGFETVAFCEIEKFPQQVLKKHWPDVPIYEDVRTLDYDGTVDVITGGYPCQPFSVAGRRKGAEDDRHLWPAMFKLIQKYRPAWVIGENVAGHINMGLDIALLNLASEGYTSRTFVIPAVAVDAKHRRDRLWIVAHTESKRPIPSEKTRNYGENKQKPHDELIRGCGSIYGDVAIVPNTQCIGQSRQGKSKLTFSKTAKSEGQAIRAIYGRKRCEWEAEPELGRVADGIPKRMDRLKSLGNAVVPQIPYIIGQAILEAHNE